VRKQFQSGEWGYVPASIRDWKAVLSADAALRKKVDRKTRKLLPLTDDVVRQHLEGKQTIGVYPLLLDETCWFLAVDFDKRLGKRTPVPFGKRAANSAFQRCSNGLVLVMAAMSGSFSSGTFPRRRHVNSEA
jgi:hypothetical protein